MRFTVTYGGEEFAVAPEDLNRNERAAILAMSEALDGMGGWELVTL